jgi:hypothetical protein
VVERPAPVVPRDAAALAPPRAAPAAASAPNNSVQRTASGAVISAPLPKYVPPPTLPRVYTAPDADQLRRICARVEALAVSLAGVSPEYAHGFTARFQAAVGPNVEIYPVAIYYWIVRSAGKKIDNVTAATGLVAIHRDGRILGLKDLPAVDGAP